MNDFIKLIRNANFVQRTKFVGYSSMSKSTFNPNVQAGNVSSKIIVGLERISEVFKVLLWEKAKQLSLSPIQIQLVIFVAYHNEDLCTVSHLAKEFNVTKPTVSDAVRVLVEKEIVQKHYSKEDSRSYIIMLSSKGKKIVKETEDFADPLESELLGLKQGELESLYQALSKLIFKLNDVGLLSVQRICYGCKFHAIKNKKDYCNLLEVELKKKDIRLDCPEFQEG